MIQAKYFTLDSSPVQTKVLKFTEPVELYFNCHHRNTSGNSCKKILILTEPNSYRKFIRMGDDDVIAEYDNFYRIFTGSQDILNCCPNAELFLFGTSWISRKHTKLRTEKQFGLSFLCGGKFLLPGHKLRHEIWQSCNDIKMPLELWQSSNNTPNHPINHPTNILPAESNSKILMFSKQYHLAIENCCEKNYFTEKIVDCFVTKTIPVYYGCTNIDDFFNKKGIIRFETSEELMFKLPYITPEYYGKHMAAVEENYRIALDNYYSPIENRLADKISLLCTNK